MTAEVLKPPLKPRQLLPRVGLFVLIAWPALIVLPILMLPLAGQLIAATLSTFGAGMMANAIAARVYEHGELSDFGLGWSPGAGREFFLGMGSGAGAAVLILVLPLIFRVATFQKQPGIEHPIAAALFVSIALLFGAVGEEMLFHGYAFQVLTRSIGAFATILPVSIVFGVAHIGNAHSTLLGIFNTVIWGVLLGYACWSSGALWLPIGLHFGWNLALPLFGANLSGFTMGVTGYALHWSVGNLWSGGDYGPEGGLPTTAVVVALFWIVSRVGKERN